MVAKCFKEKKSGGPKVAKCVSAGNMTGWMARLPSVANIEREGGDLSAFQSTLWTTQIADHHHPPTETVVSSNRMR
jgi:hypothetical protein